MLYISLPFFLFIPRGGLVILVLSISTLFALLFLKNKKTKYKRIDYVFISSFFLYFLVDIFNIFIFGTEFRELDTASRFLLVIPIYFFLINHNLSLKKMPLMIAFSSFIYGVNINFHYLLGYELFDLFKHSGIIGLYSGLLGFLTFTFVNKKNHWSLNSFYFFVFAICTLGSILTGARGVWVAQILTIFLILVLNPFAWQIKERVSIVFLSFLVLFVSYLHDNPYGIKSRITAGYNGYLEYIESGIASDSVSKRLEMWKAASLIVKENPLLGIGINKFYDEKIKLINSGLINKQVAKFNHPHNQFISSILERGVLGFLVLVFVLVFPLVYSYMCIKKGKTKDSHILIFIISCFYFFYSLTNGVFDHQNTTLFFTASIAILMGFTRLNVIKK